MGLLEGALAGLGQGLVGIGQQMAQDERTRAQEIRELNLLRLKGMMEEESTKKRMDYEHGLKESGMVDSYGTPFTNAELAQHKWSEDEEAPMTKEDYKERRAESKTWMRKTADGKYEPITNEEADNIIAAGKAKQQALTLATQDWESSDRAKTGLINKTQKGEEIESLMKSKFGEELRSWEGDTGELVRISDIDAARKHAEKLEEKREAERERRITREEADIRHADLMMNLKKIKSGGSGDSIKPADIAELAAKYEKQADVLEVQLRDASPDQIPPMQREIAKKRALADDLNAVSVGKILPKGALDRLPVPASTPQTPQKKEGFIDSLFGKKQQQEPKSGVTYEQASKLLDEAYRAGKLSEQEFTKRKILLNSRR